MLDFNTSAPWKDVKRCILDADGILVGFLDAEDSNKWENGTSVNWSEVESLGQNCLVQIPKFYYCKKVIGDERIFGVADTPENTESILSNEWEIHPAFFRDRTKPCDDQSATPIEVDFRYAPAFKGWVDGQGRLRSLPNKTPTVNKTISAFRNHAKNMGNGYSQLDFNLLYAIQMLYITEYGDPDSQTTIGRGYADGNSGSIATGSTLQYGNNSFGETTGEKQMSYRGIEDLWGNVFHWIDGFFNNASREILIGNKGFNNTGVGYKNLGVGSSTDLYGYIGDVQEDSEAGFTMGSAGGTDSSKLYDYGYLYAGRMPRAGGYWSSGAQAGVFSFHVTYSASHSLADLGSFLSY